MGDSSYMSKFKENSKALCIYFATAILHHLAQVKIYVLHKKEKEKRKSESCICSGMERFLFYRAKVGKISLKFNCHSQRSFTSNITVPTRQQQEKTISM